MPGGRGEPRFTRIKLAPTPSVRHAPDTSPIKGEDKADGSRAIMA